MGQRTEKIQLLNPDHWHLCFENKKGKKSFHCDPDLSGEKSPREKAVISNERSEEKSPGKETVISKEVRLRNPLSKNLYSGDSSLPCLRLVNRLAGLTPTHCRPTVFEMTTLSLVRVSAAADKCNADGFMAAFAMLNPLLCFKTFQMFG